MHDRRLSAAATFVALVIAAESVCRWAAATGVLYGRVPLEGAVTSVPEVRDRIRWGLRGAGPPVALFGDSVAGSTALLARGAPRARESALPRALAARAGGARVVDLAADGFLPGDLEALAAVLAREARGRPVRSVLAVNVRMLASGARAGGSLVSRDLLLAELSEEERSALAPAALPTERALARRLYAGAAAGSALFRVTQQLRAVWFHPTPKDAEQRLVDRAFGRPDTGELEEAALRLSVMGYYRERWTPGSPGLRALARAARTLRSADPGLLVVLTPQNPSFVEEGGAETFARNREALARAMGEAAPGSFVDLSAAFPEPLFLDHCHLTPEGNARLAEEILRALAARRGGSP